MIIFLPILLLVVFLAVFYAQFTWNKLVGLHSYFQIGTLSLIISSLILFTTILTLVNINLLSLNNITILFSLLTIVFVGGTVSTQPKFKRLKLSYVTKIDLVTIFIAVMWSFIVVVPSYWLSPSQSDSNSYALVGAMIAQRGGVNMNGTYLDVNAVLNRNPEIQNNRLIPERFFNETRQQYSIFGMPLYSSVVAVGHLLGLAANLTVINLVLGLLALIAFKFLVQSWLGEGVGNTFWQSWALILFALNPLQIIMMKKQFNESLSQFLILFLLVLAFRYTQTMKFALGWVIATMVLVLLVATRIETIVILILWLAWLLWDKRYTRFVISAALAIPLIVLSLSANPGYVESDLLDRASDYMEKFGMSPYAFVVLLVVISITVLFVFIFLSRLELFKLSVEYGGKWALTFSLVLAFLLNSLRIIPFYQSGGFSFDERLIGMFPNEFTDFEQIILWRLAMVIGAGVIGLGIAGIVLFVKSQPRINFLVVWLTMYLVLFTTTSQHDPNIIPWTRRYVYFVIPVLIIGAGYIWNWIATHRYKQNTVWQLLAIGMLLIFLPSSIFYLTTAEYRGADKLITNLQQTIPAGTLIIVDASRNVSTVENLKICETMHILYHYPCVQVLDINQPELINTRPAVIVSQRADLDPEIYKLFSQQELDWEAYPNSFFTLPRAMRTADFTVYLYSI